MSLSFYRLHRCLLQHNLQSVLPKRRLTYAAASRGFSSNSDNEQKKQVVVLGTGWSSLYFVKNLDLTKFDLTVVSPRNYFTFTPLLPKLSAGKISPVTCTEPFAAFMQKHKRGNFNFVHARCLDVRPDEYYVDCVSVHDAERKLSIPYDYLVVAVGAESNTFSIPGVEEHAYFLKEVEHAESIYQKIVSNFEAASLPNTSDEEKRRLLHMIVVGGGPTGVEMTGEVAVLFNKYMARTFPSLARFAKVTIVEGGQRLLATFGAGNSRFTDRVLRNNNVNVMLGKQVCAVGKDDCTVRDVVTGETERLPCGMVVWASGLKSSDVVVQIQKHFKEQDNPRALLVDQYLALRGSADRSIFAVGDCCKVTPDKLADSIDDVIQSIGSTEINALLKSRKELVKRFPQLASNKLNTSERAFKELCKRVRRSSGTDREKLLEIMEHIDNNYASPFPTAQNAKQESLYLAEAFNRGFAASDSHAFNEAWKGSLASIGGRNVVGNFPYFQLNGGITTLILWLAVYIRMFSSNKMRLSYIADSVIQKICGRHIISKQSENNRR
ncbi:NADH dehydrogenase, putative [Babesia bigemina]|uniref:NADH:ubiquinone reductase (non-electrogenic) n=1 Tax=Babesia bigemina TaxID=5866 RepID=A0A061DEX6_BABBI|nr:NADH dehydrogenase, putative [Babesia bigemina]CDR98045.1 NADH dehydrogenase, putative [Babesia bigemina]|eukprot:XP_012770231.1 NADH dehydrogenase, putative [Babesia bigemina]